MNKRYLIALFLCAACALSGCGGEQPPDAYSAAEDSLPSLTALVSPAGDPQCTEQTEDGAVSYCCTGLDNTVQAVTDYRTGHTADALTGCGGPRVPSPFSGAATRKGTFLFDHNRVQ